MILTGSNSQSADVSTGRMILIGSNSQSADVSTGWIILRGLIVNQQMYPLGR